MHYGNVNLGRDELHNVTKQNILKFFEVKNDLNMFCDIVIALLVCLKFHICVETNFLFKHNVLSYCL